MTTVGRRARKGAFVAAGLSAIALAACAEMGPAPMRPMAAMTTAPQGQPGIPASGVKPNPDNQAVIDALMTMGLRAYHTLTPAEARRQPGFGDGVKAVLQMRGRPTAPSPGIETRDIMVQGGAGMIPARVYRPAGASGPLPVVVYFHGGGWVIATIDSYDSSARGLAREANAMVVSVEYRKAPEAKFPAQHDDALAAYRWATANAAQIGGDPRRIALAGESAGGNLAVATAMQARDAGLPRPAAVLAVYPIAGSDLNTASYQENANAMPLNRAAMAWFLHHTMRAPADLMDPRINLVMADLKGLPPVTLVQAQIDPLRSEGDMLAQRLRAAGVTVTARLFPATTHEFFGADALIRDAAEAQRFAGERLRAAFAEAR